MGIRFLTVKDPDTHGSQYFAIRPNTDEKWPLYFFGAAVTMLAKSVMSNEDDDDSADYSLDVVPP